jgi:hypothetical protein
MNGRRVTSGLARRQGKGVCSSNVELLALGV